MMKLWRLSAPRFSSIQWRRSRGTIKLVIWFCPYVVYTYDPTWVKHLYLTVSLCSLHNKMIKRKEACGLRPVNTNSSPVLTFLLFLSYSSFLLLYLISDLSRAIPIGRVGSYVYTDSGYSSTLVVLMSPPILHPPLLNVNTPHPTISSIIPYPFDRNLQLCFLRC